MVPPNDPPTIDLVRLRRRISAASAGSTCSAALVVMPFASVWRPSIQVGLLKALGDARGFPQTTFHFNLDFAARIGVSLYERLCEFRIPQLGDWLFSIAAFGDRAPDPDGRMLEEFAPAIRHKLATGAGADVCAELARIRREQIEPYLEALVTSSAWDQFDVVGFTCTFQQTVPAVALARRLKQRFPRLVTLFGGANFDGEMGEAVMRSAPCIDYAISGEADDAYVQFLAAIGGGRPVHEVPGLIHRRPDGGVAMTPRAPLRLELDDLPTPDYTEYFVRATATGVIADPTAVMVPFESSRGCWWGQKSHCTFCGLNAQSMKYRAKRADRVVEELAQQASRHGTFRFEAVDNILALPYFEALFPLLSAAQSDYELFFETKSNLSRDRIRGLRAGGVTQIQPGLESLSTPILRLMRKGVTAIQNVNLLRWAHYYGISVNWNVIWGFPGEQAEDYAEQVRLFRKIVHLQPPKGYGRIWLERFSPIFTDSAAFPTTRRAPERSYGLVYPEGADLEQIAYFFDYELEHTLPDSAFAETQLAVDDWRLRWHSAGRPTLTFRRAPGIVTIEDRREAASAGRYTFRGDLAALYAACVDAPRSPGALARELALRWSDEELRGALLEFCERGLMMNERDSFLSLALPFVRGR